MIQESLANIKARLRANLKNTPPFNIPNLSPSTVSLFGVFLDTVATEIFTLEQLNNVSESELETLISNVTSPTTAWWQKQLLAFQYSATTPQIVVLDVETFSPAYEIVDPTLRIVTNASVTTTSNNVIQMKITNNGAVLNASQYIALHSYITTIDPAGIGFNIINALPDQLWIEGTIFYNGQFSAVIQANVIAAINVYMAALPFDGQVKVSALEDAIQAVTGVTDVFITSIAARAAGNGQSFADRTFFGLSTTTRFWQTYSGQIVQETTSGQTFSDTLIFQTSD